MKAALCFIISYDHVLNKEHIWRKWIEPNKVIINVYFYYKDYNKIKSDWIRNNALPQSHIHETSYYYVIPAYISLINYACGHDKKNTWLCFLTDSCCPIISPKRFRYLFFKNYNKSIISWRYAWWNTTYHKRANLALLPQEYRLANDPWFVLKREDALKCWSFIHNNSKITKIVCSGGLANESLFSIILYINKQLDNVICSATHVTDWSRMASPTSPHIFKDANAIDLKFIENELSKNKNVMFIRKIASVFPDEVLEQFIYKHSEKEDEILNINDPYILQKVFGYLFLSVLLYITIKMYLDVNYHIH